MKGKVDAYVLWPLTKSFQNWIVDRSTAGDFTVYAWNIFNGGQKIYQNFLWICWFFFLISYSGVEISITGITIIIELPSHVCFRHQFPPQVLKKCHVWHNHQLWRSTRQNLNYCYWHHNGAKHLQIFFQMRSTCYFVHQIDIINNKARNNRINAKYHQMAFRSVPTNPYLEFLVKQNRCKFRGLPAQYECCYYSQ